MNIITRRSIFSVAAAVVAWITGTKSNAAVSDPIGAALRLEDALRADEAHSYSMEILDQMRSDFFNKNQPMEFTLHEIGRLHVVLRNCKEESEKTIGRYLFIGKESTLVEMLKKAYKEEAELFDRIKDEYRRRWCLFCNGMASWDDDGYWAAVRKEEDIFIGQSGVAGRAPKHFRPLTPEQIFAEVSATGRGI